ncbi:MAG TPA: DUF547 domain-containing protein [Blastocatellia bacterium]|nr:DUF547 domain-containing protein [Blastocatellia bacterium]
MIIRALRNQFAGILLCIFSAATCVTAQTGAQRINYSEFDRLTKTYVNESGLVNYKGLKQELAALKSFVDQLAAVSPDSHPQLFADEMEKLRYFVTAYNAWVLYIVASEYPKQNTLWTKIGLFRNRPIRLGGQDSSLEDLEHGIIRKRFADPRIHFYINCAAFSCPPLAQGAIPEGKTDEALTQAARRFINDPKYVTYDAAKKKLEISRIFKWFEDDFLNHLKGKRGIEQPHVAQFILLYLEGPAKEALAKTPVSEIRVSHFGYDKSLNEQK